MRPRPALPAAFVDRPVAHRGLHDRALARPENSLAALHAAIAGRYPVELDVQLTADGEAVVFHDYDLGRLTGQKGPVRLRTAAELARIPLKGGPADAPETIPTLARFLDEGAGRTAYLIEIKDQDGAMGPATGALEEAVARALHGRDDTVALMSFNPHAVAGLAELLPHVPRGLTTSAWSLAGWPSIPRDVRRRLRDIPDFDDTGAAFISHEARDLGRARVADLKGDGVPVLCWTIRSAEAEAAARRLADNITFEGYPA